MVSQSDLVYAAALFDAVGYINISQHNYLSSYVLLEYSGSFSHFHATWLQANWGGYVSMPDPIVVSFRWRVRNAAAVTFVRQISPFVRFRNREVVLVLAYGSSPNQDRQEIALKLKNLKVAIAKENSYAAVSVVQKRKSIR